MQSGKTVPSPTMSDTPQRVRAQMSSSQRCACPANTGRPPARRRSFASTEARSHAWWYPTDPRQTEAKRILAPIPIAIRICPRRFASKSAWVTARPLPWLPADGQVKFVVSERAHVIQVQGVGQRVRPRDPLPGPPGGVPQIYRRRSAPAARPAGSGRPRAARGTFSVAPESIIHRATRSRLVEVRTGHVSRFPFPVRAGQPVRGGSPPSAGRCCVGRVGAHGTPR